MKKQILVQVFLSVLAIASLVLMPVNAQTPPPTPTPQDDSTSSTAHRDKIVVYDAAPERELGAISAVTAEDILLIQTSDPWEDSSHYVGNNWYDGITADTMVLDSLGYAYRIATWNDINSGAVNIFAYPVVLIVNDQVQAFYDNYATHVTDFENYVSSGHTLLFFAASDGWAYGTLNANLPGGVHVVTPWYQYYNYIVTSNHPIVSGQLSDGIPLVNGDLYYNYCSHGYFTSLPSGTQTLLRESQGYPTMIEYRLGNGRVVASTQTWEANWANSTGGVGYGTFARKSLDDVFLYALSGGTVPADVRLELRIEDAPAWIDVNKSRGSFVDVVARISGNAAYQASAVLEIPADKFGLPTETFTRNTPDNTGGQSVLYTNLGSGRYQITGTLRSLSWQYYKELVWRFKVPDGASPEQGIELSATVSVPGHTVQNPTSKAKLNIIDYARSIIVTNRKLLFSRYQPNPTQNDVSSLLEEVYIQAWAYNGEVFYVDLYSNAARDWSQNVDYSSETTANTVATAIDGLVDSWYNRLTEHPQPKETIRPEFLLIVGGDEIMPFYRANDGNYNSCWLPQSLVPCEEDVFPDGQTDPVLRSWDHNYFFSDNIYADVGGGKSQWEEGELELSIGRIVGHSAAAMRQFIENAWLETPALTRAVLASMGGSQVDGMLDRLNNRHVDITGLNNPDMVDNDNWSRSDWLTAWQGDWQLNYYGGHGAYNEIPGPNAPGFTHTITMDELPGGDITANHPLFIADACNLGIPTDADGATWNPEADDSVMYKMVSLGLGGMIASNGISSYDGGVGMKYGERLINDYVEYLIDFVPASGYSEYWGTALLKAKQNYPPNGSNGGYEATDNKTLMEYVYYGLPWSFVETPDNQADQALAMQQAAKGYAFSSNTPQVVALSSYSKIFTATVTSYQFVPVAGFELLDIPGSDSLYSSFKPVLPVLYTTLNLPPGATVSGIQLVNEDSTGLGQHNIPAADPASQFHPTTGYTTTMDVSGVYPPAPRYGYQTRDLGDRVEVRIAIAPATFDIGTHNVILYNSTVLRVNYDASVPVAISPLALNKPEYQVGEVITTTANIENVGASPATLIARVNVYDAAGTLIGTTSSKPFDVAGGGSHSLQIPWTTMLEPGGYRMTLSVEQAGTPQVATSASFGILAGRLSSFSAPQSIGYDEYGTFNLTFDNYRSTPITATAKVHVYNSAGVEVVSLLQRTFTANARATGNTSWSWNPAGLSQGTYTVRAVVQTGDQTYTSGSYNMQVREPPRVYLPIVTRNYGGGTSYYWLDAINGGTVVAQGDDTYQYVGLPFAFNFYGNTYTGLYVSSNGYVSFGSGYSNYGNTCIPSTSTPNNAVYAFWDDLVPTGGSNGDIYVKQIDSSTFVVEWYQVKQYSGSYYQTFEIVLRNDHSITLQYQSVSNTGSSTVGVENAAGTLAKQHICNGVGTPLANQLAIRYTTP